MANMKIPGGAYKLPDGSWINAQGKPIATPKNPSELYEPREVISSPIMRPPSEGEELALAGSEDEFSKPEELISEETDKKTTRRVTKKS